MFEGRHIVYIRGGKAFRLQQVAFRTPCLYIVQINVGIGRYRIVPPCFLAACIGDVSPVGRPCQLLYASEGLHRTFKGFAFEDVPAFAYALGRHFSDEGMRGVHHVVVPMLVHQVVNDHAGGKGQVLVVGGDGSMLRHLLDQDDTSAVGREEEVADAPGVVRKLPAVRTVGSHAPQLSLAKERDAATALGVRNPCWGGLALTVVGRSEQDGLLGGKVIAVYHGAASVLLHAIVTYSVKHLRGIGIEGYASDASHGP